MTQRHDPRLGGSGAAVLIKASLSGLGACLRKPLFAKPTSNKPQAQLRLL
jgi:hypothetical protein